MLFLRERRGRQNLGRQAQSLKTINAGKSSFPMIIITDFNNLAILLSMNFMIIPFIVVDH